MRQAAARFCALLGLAAIANNDRIGLIAGSVSIERYVPPRKGKQHVMRLVRDILLFEPQHRGTNPAAALEFVMHIHKHRAIVFLLSDFIGSGFAPDTVRIPLGIAARRHDLVAIPITDPAEWKLPRVGFVDLEDTETGEIVTVNTSSPRIQRGYEEHMRTILAGRDRLFRQLGIDSIELHTHEDFTPKLHKFFQQRARRFH